MNGAALRYVLITPARNEARHLEQTVDCVIAQTCRPIRWVIVSDGSTDATDDIVRRYSAEHSWIELERRPERADRHFAGKVMAFNQGYSKIRALDFDIVGSLDADITFDSEYFGFLMSRFAENPQLGVGGTPFREGGQQYNYNFTSIEHVSGACQLFRRECFEGIGGYVPIRGGGIDLVAVTTARMKGWQTQSFPDKVCLHHREMGTAARSRISAAFRLGLKDYALGTHPAWQFVRSLYQMSRRPYVTGGTLLLSGFVWGMLTRPERPVSEEFVYFRRSEQMTRLKRFLRRALPCHTTGQHGPAATPGRKPT